MNNENPYRRPPNWRGATSPAYQPPASLRMLDDAELDFWERVYVAAAGRTPAVTVSPRRYFRDNLGSVPPIQKLETVLPAAEADQAVLLRRERLLDKAPTEDR